MTEHDILESCKPGQAIGHARHPGAGYVYPRKFREVAYLRRQCPQQHIAPAVNAQAAKLPAAAGDSQGKAVREGCFGEVEEQMPQL